MWGFFPAFFPFLKPATPLEIIAHRILWTAVFMVILITAMRGWRELKGISARMWLRVGLASVLVGANWLIYVIAINSSQVAEAALGYFINPLVAVLLGVVFLGERLRPLQTTSVVIAAVAVLLLTFVGGHPPLLALGLAFSFAFYGLAKQRIPLSATGSLTAETLVLLPIALGYILYLEFTGRGSVVGGGTGHLLLLMCAGLITAIPLILFGKASKLIPLSTIGMLQYMTPTMQMLWAVFVTKEHLDSIRLIGFIIIWISVAVYLFDMLRHSRRRPHAVTAEPS